MDGSFSSEQDLMSPEETAVSLLVSEQAVSVEDLEQAMSLSNGTDKSILLTLNQMGVLSDRRLAEVFAQVTGIEIADPPQFRVVEEAPVLSPEFMRTSKCLCLSEAGPLYLVNPLDPRPAQAVEFVLGRQLEPKILPAGDWLRSYQALFSNEGGMLDVAEDPLGLESGLADQDRDAPIVRQVATWLAEAADLGASDAHFDARRNAFEIQYRLDGVLRPVATQSKSIAAAVIARIKVLADLDLGERNKSQDGRATIIVRGRKLDVRVSIISTIDGESAVIRLLDRPGGVLTLEQLGFSSEVTSELAAIMRQRHGLFVVAGPTGSGKTTTLYACLETLNGKGLKILSVEDPVEYHFEHVNQVQVSEKAGRDFAGALRSFLRHDPDVILVGEIRDSETAQTAVQAALSGHLVLATLHAIDTARVRTRLVDMGVEPFRLDACLMGSLAQRLVRLLCTDCKISIAPSPEQCAIFERFGLPIPSQIFSPSGCETCQNEAYAGRSVLSDFARGNSAQQDEDGLIVDALKMVARGETSFHEISGLIA